MTRSRPPYRVPTMAEITAVPRNGLVVATTFAGGGGSSLGYRMAGFRVVYANEVVEEARAAYRANAAPDTVIDPRDVREVTGEQILDAVEAATGHRVLHVLDGSPPCQVFSTAGLRHKAWGKVMAHADGTVQASDDLFFEYARLVGEIRPLVFVAENVSGLVKGTSVGYFRRILRALREPGYRVEAKLLDAQWLGVPQARVRLVFVGVRDDLGLDPVFPSPLPYRYTIRDALPNLAGPGALRLQRGPKAPVRVASLDEPAPTIAAAGVANVREYQATLPGHMPALPEPVDGRDPETGFDIALRDRATGREWDRTPPGGKSDRYHLLKRPDPDRPSPTITATAARPGQAGVCHPTERRKFTLAELRRLCSFPDDYVLPGGKFTDGWARLGNAVPPLLMRAVAERIRDDVLGVIPAPGDGPAA